METWTAIANILEAIVLAGAAVAVIVKWLQPAREAKDTRQDHERRIESLEKHEKENKETLESIITLLKGILLSEVSILNHNIDGNGKEKMKETRDDITEMLANLK